MAKVTPRKVRQRVTVKGTERPFNGQFTARQLAKIETKHLNKLRKQVEKTYKDNAPVGATGKLRKNIKTTRGSVRTDGTVGFYTRTGKTEYANPVSTGARPHATPWRNLLPWVRKKFVNQKNEQGAYALARYIGYYGTSSNKYLEKSAEQVRQRLFPDFKKALETELRNKLQSKLRLKRDR